MSAEDEVQVSPLDDREVVCEVCWLAYWQHHEKCPNCAFWGDPE